MQLPSASWFLRVLGNAGVLALAMLLVASFLTGRFAYALVWLGALLVLLVQQWQGALGTPDYNDDAELRFHWPADGLRLLGAGCALVGVVLSLL